MNQFKPGDAVRVERDEKAYPPQGSWRLFRNRPGFVVMVNEEAGEYGVVLTTTRPPWRSDRPGELSYDSEMVSWFQPHELRARHG